MKNAAGRLLGLLLICGIATRAMAGDSSATTRPTPVKTGPFEITFTERSPLSEYSKLLERTGATKDELGPDYNPADEPFVAYVPPDYDERTPFGLIVQSFQDGSPDIYEPIRAVLDAHHLIMVATKKDHLAFGTNTGVCIDAVYNLRKTYNIDPSRIYLLGLSKYIEPIGLSTGDVFTGDIYVWWCDYFRQVGTMAPVVKFKPPPAMLQKDGLHMQVLGFNDVEGQTWFDNAVAGAMHADGMDHVVVAPVKHDDILTPEWLEKMLNLVESVKPPRPEPIAVTDEPAQLLRVAQAYITGGLTDRARDKLNQLIQKYPNDPAAAKAKELLQQLNTQ